MKCIHCGAKTTSKNRLVELCGTCLYRAVYHGPETLVSLHVVAKALKDGNIEAAQKAVSLGLAWVDTDNWEATLKSLIDMSGGDTPRTMDELVDSFSAARAMLERWRAAGPDEAEIRAVVEASADGVRAFLAEEMVNEPRVGLALETFFRAWYSGFFAGRSVGVGDINL